MAQKKIKTSELTGTTAFLNGEPGLHGGIDSSLFKAMQKAGMAVTLIDNLFEQPERLKEVIEADNLVLFTTGLRMDKMEPLVKVFRNMKTGRLKYFPKVVIFLTDGTAMAFVAVARNLKKHGTEFYFVDTLNNETLYEISWL